MASPPPLNDKTYAAPPPPLEYAYNPPHQPAYNSTLQPPQPWGQNQVGQQYSVAPSNLEQGQGMPTVLPPSYESAPYGAVNPDTGLPAKFNPKPRYNDCWAFVLFIAQLAAFIVLAVFALEKIEDDRHGAPQFGTASFFSKPGYITVLIAILTGLIVSVVYFMLVEAMPRMVIKVTFLLSIIAYIASAVYFFVRHQWYPAVVTAVFSLLYATMWFFWKSRIPFATEMLKAVTSISKKYPATFMITFIALLIQTMYSVFFTAVIAGCYELYYDWETRTTPGKLQVYCSLIFFCFVSFYWTSQVIKNIAHVTISGLFATYYFMMGSPQGMTKSPTYESFKRAMTTSIGSICFGSLIIAVIQSMRALAQTLRSDSSDGLLACLGCIIDCILACFQGLIEYVNKYAFCQVAIYGKAYIPAARDTWTMLKDRGIVAIINDNLIGNVWAMGAIMSGSLSALACYLYLWFDNPPFNFNNEFTYVLVTIAFVMGLQMLFTVGAVIESGVATTFVCLAEDPAALARTKPELFERIRATWPAVVQGVNY
ncbi:putative choline transporter, neither null mutation nor overexpression affects choline transport [Dissophora globulifera]|uniref:Protein PNS1 n=1 Tax=Dissophora globulifera TaxID=979702 RepID=A0A9P6UK67_9FUNG|nr:putative choline transporter, neither null mutation nor overexpression affects choline transport [Dissophora globulifera]